MGNQCSTEQRIFDSADEYATEQRERENIDETGATLLKQMDSLAKPILRSIDDSKESTIQSQERFNPIIRMLINGQEHSVRVGHGGVTLRTTLHDWMELNSQATQINVRKSCGTGYCGACTVMLTFVDASTGKHTHRMINSCLRSLASCNGMAITTVEGINVDGKTHPIKESIKDNNASQCGYCTPGMVMNLYTALASGKGLKTDEIMHRLDGNVCRCTGYGPIVETFKAFADDDCKEASSAPSSCCKGRKLVHFNPPTPGPLPEFVDYALPLPNLRPLWVESDNVFWYEASDEADLQKLLQAIPVEKQEDVMLVAGNTTSGLSSFYGPQRNKIYINIASVKGMNTIQLTENTIKIGATATISDAVEFFKAFAATAAAKESDVYEHLTECGKRSPGSTVRHSATIGGNVMIAYQHQKQGHFPVEWPMLLWAVGATIVVVDAVKETQQELDWQEFYDQSTMAGKYIKFFSLPVARKGQVFRGYSARQRTVFAEAYASAAMTAVVESGKVVPSTTRIVVNNIGRYPQRLPSLEKLFDGVDVTSPDMPPEIRKALNVAIEQIRVPGYGDEPDMKGFKESLCRSFLQKFWFSLDSSLPSDFHNAAKPYLPPSKTNQAVYYPEPKPGQELTKAVPKIDALGQAEAKAHYVGDEPIPAECLHAHPIIASKVGPFKDLLGNPLATARLVPGFYAMYAASNISDVMHNEAQEKNAQQYWNYWIDQRDMMQVPIFAESKTSFLGQVLGVVLASTPEAARTCAFAAQEAIEWDEGNCKIPVVDIREAIKMNQIMTKDPKDPDSGPFIEGDDKLPLQIQQKFNNRTTSWETCTTDEVQQIFSNAQQSSIQSLTVFGQYHYAMEPISALALPLDSWASPKLTLHVSTRSPARARMIVYQYLKDDLCDVHDIEIKCNRVGGAYGCKYANVYPALLPALAGALATKRPVRIVQDLEKMLRMNGIRCPYHFDKVEVAFDDTGRIQAVRGTIYVEAGCLLQYDPTGLASWALNFLDNVYLIPHWDVRVRFVRTDMPPQQVMRAPGTLLASTFIENCVINAVATKLNMDAYAIRQLNCYDQFLSPARFKTLKAPGPGHEPMIDFSDGKIKKIRDHFLKLSDYDARRAAVLEFNRKSRWVKKGLSLCIARYPVNVGVSSIQYDTRINISLDGSVLVISGAVELGQGVYTKVAQAVADSLFHALGYRNMTVDNVSFGRKAMSQDLIDPNYDTGVGNTSQLAVWSAQEACKILVARLAEMMEVRKINPGSGEVDDWRKLIHQSLTWKGSTEKKVFCARQKVENPSGPTGMNLTAQAYVPNVDVAMDTYNALVAGLTELTLDGMTGEVEIGRVDCMVDMGISMNPLSDWGQIQGSWVQGIGHCLCEKRSQPESLDYQVDWFDYHPPSSFEMPKDFRLIIDPDQNVRNLPITIGARSMAEPTVYVGCSTTEEALQMAINAVREDNGHAPQLAANLPILVNERQALCRAGDQ